MVISEKPLKVRDLQGLSFDNEIAIFPLLQNLVVFCMRANPKPAHSFFYNILCFTVLLPDQCDNQREPSQQSYPVFQIEHYLQIAHPRRGNQIQRTIGGIGSISHEKDGKLPARFR
jgi:hypothetical protein